MTTRSPPKSVESDLMRARTGLSITLAICAAFFLSPVFYRVTIGWVQSFTAFHYAPDLSEIVSFIWFSGIGIGLFFGAWAAFSLGLTLAFTRLAARML